MLKSSSKSNKEDSLTDLSGVILKNILEQNMEYDYSELLGLITFSLNAVAVGLSYIVYNLLIHLVNDPEE